MVSLQGGGDGAAGTVAERPRSLREVLEGIPRAQRDHYLSLREAFLSLERTSERFRRARSCWRPILRVGGSEVATIGFVRQVRRGMTVQVKPMPADWLADLATASEVRPVTRRRLRNGTPGRATALPVNSDSDLADAVVILLLLHARVMGGARL